MQVKRKVAKTVLSLLLAANCHVVQAKSDRVHGKKERNIGWASYYSDRFHGRRTASGERYDRNALTAVHSFYPFGTVLRVTNLRNHRSVHVRINDRWPRKYGRRILDLSKRAAKELGFVNAGLAHVKLEVVELGEG